MSKRILKYRDVGISRFQNFFTGLKSKKNEKLFSKVIGKISRRRHPFMSEWLKSRNTSLQHLYKFVR